MARCKKPFLKKVKSWPWGSQIAVKKINQSISKCDKYRCLFQWLNHFYSVQNLIPISNIFSMNVLYFLVFQIYLLIIVSFFQDITLMKAGENMHLHHYNSVLHSVLQLPLELCWVFIGKYWLSLNKFQISLVGSAS